MISHLYKNEDEFYRSEITRVFFPKPDWELKGGSLFFIGSCFADYLFKAFSEVDLDVQISPFGNIYNPESLAEAAKLISKGGKIKESDCFKTQKAYRHFMFHSLRQDKNVETLTHRLNAEISFTREYLKKAEAVVITFGTSIVYKLKKDFSDNYLKGQVVNNCHKIETENFYREQLSLFEATEAIKKSILYFKKINPRLRIILTLSPVRHLRDDATENSLSKAVLRCAIEQAIKDTNVLYFPSYEIMLDELRDYRWYAEDLCHPSAKAVEYIISIFVNRMFCRSFKDFFEKLLKLQANLNHKPINPESEEYKEFLAKTYKQKRILKEEYYGLK